MIRNTRVAKPGPAAPNHRGLGTSVTAVLGSNLLTMYGPPDQVGTVLLKYAVAADSSAFVSVPPFAFAMWNGKIGPNRLFQSVYGVENTTVAVLPLSEEVIDLMLS